MRLAVFDENRLGILQGDQLQDVTDWAHAHSPWRTMDPMVAFIHAMANPGAQPEGPRRSASGVRFGPPLRHPGKIVAAAANYAAHHAEMESVPKPSGARGDIRSQGFFLKAPSSIIGPEDSIRLPFADRRTDHESEIAVVIGRTARAVEPAQALEYVFGYTGLLDITVRGGEDRGLRKSYDTFTPLGPYVTTRDEVPDPNDLQIRLTVNGELRQDASSRMMIVHVPELIAWISSVMTLYPGDVIATGTPEGVGPIKPGDRLELSIERLGSFAVGVVAGY